MTTLAFALAFVGSLIVNPGTPDVAVRLPDGRLLQTESIGFVIAHAGDPRLVVFEDGSAALVDCEQDAVRGPNLVTIPFTC